MATDCRPEKVGSVLHKFLKIVLNPAMDRLRIPTEFTRRIGYKLPNCVSLKVPSGFLWKVELIHSNGETWLHKGWLQFIEYYSVGLGHLLLFNYDGKSHFDGHIFDTTAIEIAYPNDASQDRKVGPNNNVTSKNREEAEDHEELYLEIFDHSARNEKKRKLLEGEALDAVNSIGSSGDNPMRMRKSARMSQNISSHVEMESKSMLSSPYQSEYSQACPLKLDFSAEEGDENTEMNYLDRERAQLQTRDIKKRCIAYQRASAFMSDVPSLKPYYIVEMHPSYVRRCYLNIQFAFARISFPCTRINYVHLRVSEGKTWFVRCTIGKERASLTTGWVDFVQDNSIKVNDACIFEVAEKSKHVWNVLIFRC